jgi:hypothetical protein
LVADANRTAAQKTGEMPRIVVFGIEPDQKTVGFFEQGMRAAGRSKTAMCRSIIVGAATIPSRVRPLQKK